MCEEGDPYLFANMHSVFTLKPASKNRPFCDFVTGCEQWKLVLVRNLICDCIGYVEMFWCHCECICCLTWTWK